MSDNCCNPSTSITPCEFPFANEECPIGYISTQCVNYQGEDDTDSNIVKGELLTETIGKMLEFIKQKHDNIVSDSITVEQVSHPNGLGFKLEVLPSTDEGNTLIIGNDGRLYGLPFSGYVYLDTNTIDFYFNASNNTLKANLKIVQSGTVTLTSTPAGLKADLAPSLLTRLDNIEARLTTLENL